jgi:hypothetical protein
MYLFLTCNKMENIEKASGYINFSKKGQRGNYTIHIYRQAHLMSLAKIGSYSTTNGLKILEENIFRERDGALVNRNRKRIIVSIKDEPFFMLKQEDGKNYTGNDRYEGYCVELAERLSQVVNFTYELRMVKDNKFGTKGKMSFIIIYCNI